MRDPHFEDQAWKLISQQVYFSGAGVWCWPLVTGVWCWRLVLAFGAGVWCWRLVLAFGAGVWCWRLVLTFGAGVWCWRSVLEFGAGVWCWRLRLILCSLVMDGSSLIKSRSNQFYFQMWYSINRNTSEPKTLRVCQKVGKSGMSLGCVNRGGRRYNVPGYTVHKSQLEQQL